MIRKNMRKTLSIRSQIIALQKGGQIIFRGVHEGTLRNTCSTIANLCDKTFSVSKKGDTFIVNRYE